MRGVEREGIHTAFASGDVCMADNTNQLEILRSNHQRISGAAPMFEEPGSGCPRKNCIRSHFFAGVVDLIKPIWDLAGYNRWKY